MRQFTHPRTRGEGPWEYQNEIGAVQVVYQVLPDGRLLGVDADDQGYIWCSQGRSRLGRLTLHDIPAIRAVPRGLSRSA